MRRRAILRAAAGAGLPLATAGCLEEELTAAEREPHPISERFSPEEIDLPVRQRYAVAGAAIERSAGAGIEDLDGLEAHLEELELRIATLEETESAGEPIVDLEVAVEPDASRGFMDVLGAVAGGYAALVDAGQESERLEATLLDRRERAYGAFEVERQWAEEYLEGELTAREYAGEVTTTAETSGG